MDKTHRFAPRYNWWLLVFSDSRDSAGRRSVQEAHIEDLVSLISMDNQLINLDSIALHNVEENLIDFNSPAPLRPVTTVDKGSGNVNTDGGQGQPPEEVTTLPPPLTPSQATLPTVGKTILNEEARPRRATRLPDRYRDFLLD